MRASLGASLLGMQLAVIRARCVHHSVGRKQWLGSFAISGYAIFMGLGAGVSEPLVGRLLDRLGVWSVALAYVPMAALVVGAVALVAHSVRLYIS